MNPKNARMFIILVSIVFAIAILISSQVFAGTRYGGVAIFMLIALWFVPYTYFIKLKNRNTELNQTKGQRKSNLEKNK